MKWSAIITTYNSENVIGRALRSLADLPLSEKPSVVVVVDNASIDHTVNIVESYRDAVPLKIVQNKLNMGLSMANNTGAAGAEKGSLFFLNPDVEILPGAITVLFKFQEEHPNAAIIGPGMTDEDGVQQSTARSWPGPLVIASRRTLLGQTPPGRRISLLHLNRFNSSGLPARTQWLVGAAMWLTPNGLEKVGLMSEKYFLYFEDVEWCWRAWKKGMEVWFEPGAKIRHVCRRESASGGTTFNHHLKSMLRFFISHPAVLLGAGPGRRI